MDKKIDEMLFDYSLNVNNFLNNFIDKRNKEIEFCINEYAKLFLNNQIRLEDWKIINIPIEHKTIYLHKNIEIFSITINYSFDKINYIIEKKYQTKEDF